MTKKRATKKAVKKQAIKKSTKKAVKKTAVKKAAKKAVKRSRSRRRVEQPAPEELRVAALRMERMNLSDLNPHPRNSEIRDHPEKGSPRWKTLVASLEHDYFDPLVHNERNGYLVSGHLRLKVMQEMGFDQVDVVIVDYDEPTHIARMMAANRTMGDDIMEGQKAFFEELESAGLDLDLTGFDPDSITDFNLGGEGGEGENETTSLGDIPPIVEQTINNLVGEEVRVTSGQHWRCGPHHVFCGPVSSGDRSWMDLLRNEPDTLLLVRAGVFTLTSEEIAPCICLEPDPLHASILVSNYVRVFGEDGLEMISSEED